MKANGKNGQVASAKFSRRYPWAKWLAKKRFTLRQGRDYTARTDSMAQMVRQAARVRYKLIRIVIAADFLSLSVIVQGNLTIRNRRRPGRPKWLTA